MGWGNIFIRKQNFPCSEPRPFIHKETILWEGYGHELADYLTTYKLRRRVEEPEEILEEVQGLLSQEDLGYEDEWIRKALTLLSEVLSKEPKSKRYVG